MIILPELSADGHALNVAQKILKSLQTPFHIDGILIHTSGSIGIAIYPDHGVNETELTNNADMAMYGAKSSGKNAVRVYSHQTTESITRDLI
ncbi:diguanylate cyclase domain-containing protein [Polynucleobacter necessarius]|uniref:diguanylate cyclase domain-containing protein n=1 Tax=Polynucleobacter necessarius TaxID=576610 RepID=UPI000E08E060|nr:GGDEF domain-containing protein [Polynucleobacter necessarius]